MSKKIVLEVRLSFNIIQISLLNQFIQCYKNEMEKKIFF